MLKSSRPDPSEGGVIVISVGVIVLMETTVLLPGSLLVDTRNLYRYVQNIQFIYFM